MLKDICLTVGSRRGPECMTSWVYVYCLIRARPRQGTRCFSPVEKNKAIPPAQCEYWDWVQMCTLSSPSGCLFPDNYSLPSQACLLLQLCATTHLPVYLFMTDMLSFLATVTPPSESPVHPIPAFLCACVSAFSSLPCWTSQVSPWSCARNLHLIICGY